MQRLFLFLQWGRPSGRPFLLSRDGNPGADTESSCIHWLFRKFQLGNRTVGKSSSPPHHHAPRHFLNGLRWSRNHGWPVK
jgi:hypothetical protein